MLTTKECMDIAVDAGIDLRNDDVLDDCIEAWYDHCIKTPSVVKEFWLDALGELAAREGASAHSFERIVDNMVSAISSKELMDRHSRLNLDVNSTAVGLSFQLAFVGMEIVECLTKYLRKHLEDNGAEWLADVVSYCGDMEEESIDDRADYAYEDARERKMEEDNA